MKHCPLSTSIWSWGPGSLAKKEGRGYLDAHAILPRWGAKNRGRIKIPRVGDWAKGLGRPFSPSRSLVSGWCNCRKLNNFTYNIGKKNYLTNRLYVAVPLLGNRSQMTSKGGKNNERAGGECVTDVLPHFDVLCDLLMNRPTATWNLFVLYNDQKRKKTETHTCLVPLDCLTIWASLGICLVPSPTFCLCFFLFFLYVNCVQFLWKVSQLLFLLKAE